MSKCVRCGNELITSDIHWEMGLCNQCWNVYRHERKPIPQYVDMLNKETYELQIENLKQQLAEKDNTIEELTKQLFNKSFIEHETRKQLRHEICEEIRKNLPYYKYSFQEPEVPRVDVIEMRDIEFILDQIERGEK